MKLAIAVLTLLTVVGCRSPNRVSSIVVHAEMKAIAREEQSVAGFERRLEERGGKIELGPKAGERVAIIPVPGSLEYVRVVYLANGSRVVVLRTEIVPAPLKFG